MVMVTVLINTQQLTENSLASPSRNIYRIPLLTAGFRRYPQRTPLGNIIPTRPLGVGGCSMRGTHPMSWRRRRGRRHGGRARGSRRRCATRPRKPEEVNTASDHPNHSLIAHSNLPRNRHRLQPKGKNQAIRTSHADQVIGSGSPGKTNIYSALTLPVHHSLKSAPQHDSVKGS